MGLALVAFAAGCRREPAAGQVSATPPTTPATTAVTNLESHVTALRTSFAGASLETRQRVEAAVQTLQEGKNREAIHALKLIDADSNLESTQQEAIRNLIIHAQPRPTPPAPP